VFLKGEVMFRKNVWLASIASVWFTGGPFASGVTTASAAGTSETVAANDNTRAAGVLSDGALTLRLRAATGLWRPEGADGPALSIDALGEASASLTVPAPLIRVVEGTPIVVSIHNELGSPLHVNGLCAREGSPCAPIDVPPGETREARFMSGKAGTYHYWATTMGAPVPFRELAGGFIVDPPGRVEPDRVLVITEWSNLTPMQLGRIITADDTGAAFLAADPRFVFVINGLSWPATERMTYRRGERVRWRVINLSSQIHPMHLHGFYFDVVSQGDGLKDSPIDSAHMRRVVTQLVPSGGTMTMAWTPEREGNWLFHCHIMAHVSPTRRLSGAESGHVHGEPGMAHGEPDSVQGEPRGAHGQHPIAHDEAGGMAGMILGVTVLPTEEGRRPAAARAASPRKLTLTIQRRPGDASGGPAAGFVLAESAAPPGSAAAAAPGPAIVLHRSEPVEITVENRLTEATALHWHGMELDSFYDGVHNWSGIDRQLAPMIEPGGTFVVRFTPPRSGTFIYHTHLHDYVQLSSGMYGPLIVLDEGETFDPATDHVVVLGRRSVTSEAANILQDAASVVINGQREPRFVWKAATKHRVRLINITPDDIFNVSLQTVEAPMMWTPITKDGALLPGAESTLVPARQTIAVGETYDFEYVTAGRKTVWLEVRTTSGKWQAQGEVIVK
jgi:FtsP/CotA-like multicopper oxidase with cupredoxin domain